MKVLNVILLCIIVNFNAPGQTKSEIDSLTEILILAKDDIIRVDIMCKIALSYYRSESDSTYKYGSDALILSNKINYVNGRAKSYRMLGLSYAGKSDYEKALKYYKKAIEEFKKTKSIEDIAIVLTSIGIIYRKKGEYETALDNYLKSLEIIKLSGDSAKIAAGYTNVGIIYKIIKDYDRAIDYQIQSIEINRKIGNRKGLPYAYGNLALTYQDMGKFKEAEFYLKEALVIFEENNYKNEIGQTYIALSEIYIIQKKYQDAFNCIQKANKIFNETGNKSGQGESFIILGHLYLLQQKYSVAESALLLGLEIAEETESRELLFDAYLYMSKLDSAKKDFKNALFYYKKHISLKDSMFSQEKNETIAKIRTKYDISEKERENILLKKNQEINEIEIKRQTLLNYTVTIALILLIAVVLLIIFSYLKLKNINKLLKSKNEEISVQNMSLKEYKEEIETQYEKIRLQNEKLEIYKNELESLVQERTKELNEALIEVRNSDNLKTQFLENLSHEIRTPMNAISGFSSFLAKDNFNIKPEYLYGIHKGMDDLTNTIDRLVVFSKFQLGQYKLNPVQINLQEYITELKLLSFIDHLF